MSEFESYLNTVESAKKTEMAKIITIVDRLVPEAEKSISYGMPTYKYKNKPLIYIGAFKNHMSLFPTAGPSETLKDKLKNYKVSKGTIQFTTDNPLPEALVEEIIRCRKNIIDKT